MTDGTEGWRFFDAESGLLPDGFSPSILPGGGSGRIVAIAATPSVRAGGWASRAVVAIAREWAQQDLRIFLMDLGLDDPTLHDLLGLPNGEGVTDAFLYGASVQRIAQPALDDTIFFASAGTATSDPEEILGHPRWNDLAGGFSEADATLLLFLPTDLPGAEKIMSRATDILFLAEEGESVESHLGPAAVKVAAVLGPVERPSEDGGSPGTSEAAGTSAPDPLAGGLFGLAGDFPAEPSPAGGAAGKGLDIPLSLAEGFTRQLEDVKEGMVPDEAIGEDQPDLQEAPEEASVAREPPDFGAEFAAMPPLDDEEGVSGVDEVEEIGEEGVISPEIPGVFLRGSGFDVEGEGAPDAAAPEKGGTDLEDPPAPVTPPPPRRAPAYPPDRVKPVSKRRPPPRQKWSRPLLAGVATAVVILLAAVGTALGFFSVPGLTWLQGIFGDTPYPALTTGAPEPVDPVLRFSLQLDIYEPEDLDLAVEMRNTLRQRLPDLLFYLTPLEVEGTVSYALQAGPAADVVEAENLRGPLAEVMTREDPEAWAILPTPRAFLLGVAETLQEAQAMLEQAEEDGALGYLVQGTYPDGTTGYEALSGAFQDVQDARWWQLTLRDAGFRNVPLIERRGRPPE